MPSLPTLLTHPARHELRYERPSLRAILIDESDEYAILIVSPWVFFENFIFVGVGVRATVEGVLPLGTFLTILIVSWFGEVFHHVRNNLTDLSIR